MIEALLFDLRRCCLTWLLLNHHGGVLCWLVAIDYEEAEDVLSVGFLRKFSTRVDFPNWCVIVRSFPSVLPSSFEKVPEFAFSIVMRFVVNDLQTSPKSDFCNCLNGQHFPEAL